jgi:predicted dehydrogenase
MKRLGLIGLGAWGKRYVQTIGRRTDCQVVAFARASASGGEDIPNAQRFSSWRALVQAGAHDLPLDGVIVATTPDNQVEVALSAVAWGIPALVEKPLGISRGGAQSVLDAMRACAAPPPVMVDYIHLCAPGYQRLRSLAQSAGRPVVAIEAEGFNKGPFREWSALHDYASHDLAMCLDLLGRDVPFVLHEGRRISPVDAKGALHEFRFDLGAARVVMRSGNGAETKARRLAVHFDDGRELVYDDLLPHPDKLHDSGQAVPVDETLPLELVLTQFFAQCDEWRNGTLAPEAAMETVRSSTRIAELLDALAASIA